MLDLLSCLIWQVLDLLNPATVPPSGALKGLRLRWSPARQFFVDNLYVEEVGAADEPKLVMH